MVICSKCYKFTGSFVQTKKGKYYCPICWSSVLEWLKEKHGINLTGCNFCGDKIFWTDEVKPTKYQKYKRVQLCEECYKYYILNQKINILEVKKDG